MKRILVLTAVLFAAAAPVEARGTLKSMCRLKGQEENTLTGVGLVMGLKGTGDGSSFLPTLRSLDIAFDLLGVRSGKNPSAELKDAKNVALVNIVATVPAAGARQGDRLDCIVTSVGSAKSLQGGHLFIAQLTGPNPQDKSVYATASGLVALDDPQILTTGRVSGGCQIQRDIYTPFVSPDGKITLVLDRSRADFQAAQEVADLINSGKLRHQSSGQPLARALNQNNVEVVVPPQYRDDPVDFVAQVLSLEVPLPTGGARVVVNPRQGCIVIGEDVEIAPAVVAHKNVLVETGPAQPPPPGSRVVPVDTASAPSAKLKGLVEALNALHVPPADMVQILQNLDRGGHIQGQLILE